MLSSMFTLFEKVRLLKNPQNIQETEVSVGLNLFKIMKIRKTAYPLVIINLIF